MPTNLTSAITFLEISNIFTINKKGCKVKQTLSKFFPVSESQNRYSGYKGEKKYSLLKKNIGKIQRTFLPSSKQWEIRFCISVFVEKNSDIRVWNLEILKDAAAFLQEEANVLRHYSSLLYQPPS